jgi:hypothetical protein
MEIKLILNADDYLTYHLYIASQSKTQKNKRYRSWVLLTISSFALSYVLKNNDKFLTWYFLFVGFLCLIFYPFYQRYYYKKHYRKFVNEKLQYKLGKENNIDFGKDAIYSKSATGEGRINSAEIAEIIEIGTHYFLKFKSGDSLIIPKALIKNELFVPELMAVLQNPAIILTKQLNWKWK